MNESSPDGETQGEHIAIYARTSTDSQKHGMESQIHSCRRRVEEDGGGQSDVQLYIDRATSGTEGRDTRQGFSDLVQAIQDGTVTKLYVSELSRISRNTLTLMQFLENIFEEEIGLVVVDGSFPSFEQGNPFMRALARMMAVLAELERDLIAARVERGIQRAIDSGKWRGRPPKGFTTNSDGHLVVKTAEYATIVAALDAINKGQSIYSVARATGVSEQTLSDIWNDASKRALYTKGESDDERKQEALDKAAGELRSESDISQLYAELTDIKSSVETIQRQLE